MDMEVDSGESSLLVLVEHVVESSPESLHKCPKERILDLLDDMDLRVERLKQQAFYLEEEKDNVLTTLATLKSSDLLQNLSSDEREDILKYADWVSTRCHTVEVPLKAERDSTQEESLHEVNRMIDSLVMQQYEDPTIPRQLCFNYLNACSSSVEEGVTDKSFESAIIACTVYDQKRIKKRLQGLLHYFDKQTL